jgi:threonine/homoserine/homoserine lactone efflux protein
VGIGTVMAFWAISLLFVITPGADWAYAIAGGLRARISPAVLGLLSGHAVATIVVAVGVGALVAKLPWLLTTLTVAGAAYLAWLGVMTLLHPPTPTAASEHETSWLRWAGKGMGVSGLNPKVFLLFLALLPQFTSPQAAWPIPVQIAVLGAVHVLSCAVIYTVVAVGARVVLSAKPEASLWVSRISGVVMIGIGLLLVVERLLA